MTPLHGDEGDEYFDNVTLQCKGVKRPRKRKMSSAAMSDRSEDESVSESPPTEAPTKTAEQPVTPNKG